VVGAGYAQSVTRSVVPGIVPPLHEQVVVILGASSGIGREAARQFARRGARVVVSARHAAALDELALELAVDGATVLAVPADVTVMDEVTAVVDRTLERFGAIDTWVNCAAVSSIGEVADIPIEELDQVITTTLLGQVHGVRAVLPVMRAQGAGTIVGVSSVLGVRAIPMQAAYSAAKHGVEGFHEALRLEERRARTGVRVTTVLPSSVNTPFYDDAPTHTDVRPAPIPPTYEPEPVAEAIVRAAGVPLRRVIVGVGAFLDLAQRISPALTDRLLLVRDQIVQRQRSDRPDDGSNNLFQPPTGWRRASGSFGRFTLRRSITTRLVGQRPWRRERGAIARSIEVAAPAEAVFRELCDLDELRRWSTITADHDGPGGLVQEGQRFRQRLSVGGLGLPSEWRCVECDPPHAVAYEATTPLGGGLRMRQRVTPTATGSHLAVQVRYRLPGWALGRVADAVYVHRWNGREADRTLDNLREVVESAARAPLAPLSG
jgi:NAD(P)-dependent dehydrogenase (short-subunit alcohol dehydrogenase family)/uncharacterized protein YndB with AHSA1/START domain